MCIPLSLCSTSPCHDQCGDWSPSCGVHHVLWIRAKPLPANPRDILVYCSLAYEPAANPRMLLPTSFKNSHLHKLSDQQLTSDAICTHPFISSRAATISPLIDNWL